jgi:hypothetical protein
MLLVSWRIADTVVALAAGLAVASFVTLRAARTHLKIDPFLSGSVSRGFLLAFIWLVVFGVVYSTIHLPYTRLFGWP